MKGLIQLCFSKIIDKNASDAWSRQVFDATFKEYYMQVQRFDPEGKFADFSAFQLNDPNADQLQYLVSTSIIGYLKLLNGKIPDVFNHTGQPCVPFKNFKFEIIDSHRTDRSRHQVAIHFYSDELLWVDQVGEYLLLSERGEMEKLEHAETVSTFSIRLNDHLGISAFKSKLTLP